MIHTIHVITVTFFYIVLRFFKSEITRLFTFFCFASHIFSNYAVDNDIMRKSSTEWNQYGKPTVVRTSWSDGGDIRMSWQGKLLDELPVLLLISCWACSIILDEGWLGAGPPWLGTLPADDQAVAVDVDVDVGEDEVAPWVDDYLDDLFRGVVWVVADLVDERTCSVVIQRSGAFRSGEVVQQRHFNLFQTTRLQPGHTPAVAYRGRG